MRTSRVGAAAFALGHFGQSAMSAAEALQKAMASQDEMLPTVAAQAPPSDATALAQSLQRTVEEKDQALRQSNKLYSNLKVARARLSRAERLSAVEADQRHLEDVRGQTLDAGVHGLALAGLADAEVRRAELGDLPPATEQEAPAACRGLISSTGFAALTTLPEPARS